MEELKKILEKREKELIRLKKEKEEALQNAPEGSLRICCHGNRIQYYYRDNLKNSNGIYIREKEHDFAGKLAQKDYDQKVLRAVNQELSVIRNYLAGYPQVNPEQVYGRLHKERQKLIKPILETDEQFVQNWAAIPYQGKRFDESTPVFFTAREERVRSKSELIIADLLHKNGIPYKYECPIYLKGLGQVHPDFTVLNVKKRRELYWEHLGMMDDPSYAEKALQKIAMYEHNGIFPGERLLITYETRKSQVNQKLVQDMIRYYL